MSNCSHFGPFTCFWTKGIPVPKKQQNNINLYQPGCLLIQSQNQTSNWKIPVLNPCTALSKAPAPEPAYNNSTNRTTNRTQVSSNFPEAVAQRPHESRIRVRASGGSRVTTAVASCRTEVMAQSLSPYGQNIRTGQKHRQGSASGNREGKGNGERRTAVGLRREKHRGHRGEPRPGLMVGSRWRCAPLRSFSSYTSRVPMPIAGEGCAAAAAPARGSLLGCGLG